MSVVRSLMDSLIPELAALSQGHGAEDVIEELIERIRFEAMNDLGLKKSDLPNLTDIGLLKFNASVAGRYEAVICSMIRRIDRMNHTN